MKTRPTVRAINWHITDRCNYRCQFCFAQNLGCELTDPAKVESVLKVLADRGVEKINFAGGEPFLHPAIGDMFRAAKDRGMTVGVVTNGSLLDETRVRGISGVVDWVGVSIDSGSEEIESALGRGAGHHVEDAKVVCRAVRDSGMMLKINTVVTKANCGEVIVPLIEELSPDRWKVFQCLRIEGQNEKGFMKWGISEREFDEYEKNNRGVRLRGGDRPVFERQSDMIGGYLMLSPSGDLIQNYRGVHRIVPFEYLLEHDIDSLVDLDAFTRRGGNYDWRRVGSC